MDNTKVHQKQHLKEGDHAFDQSSVLKVLIKNSLPIVLLMIANSFYTLIDALLAVKFVTVDNHGYNGGDVVGAVFPLAQFMMAFSMFYVVGIGLYYSKRLGQNRYEEAEQGVGQAIMLSVVIGASLYVIFLIIVGPYVNHIIGNSNSFLVTSDTNPEFGNDPYANRELAITAGRNFLLVLGFSAIPLSVMNSLVRTLRSEGKGLAAALIPILPIPLNLGFDTLMMGVFGTGIWGAGFATFVAALTTMIIIICYVLYEKSKNNTYISFRIGLWKPIWPTMLVIIAFGATSFIRRIGASIVMVSLSSHITSLGSVLNNSTFDIFLTNHVEINNFFTSVFPGFFNDEWAATWNAMARTLIFQNRIALGIAQSVAMICAYHYGKKNYKKINQTLIWGFIGALLISGTMGILLIICSDPLIESFGVLKDDSDFLIYQLSYISGTFFVFMNGMALIPIMYYSASRNIKATLIHVIVITIILFSATFIGKSMVTKTNDEKSYFYTMLLAGFIANIFVVFLFSYYVHNMNKNVRLYGFHKKPEQTKLLKESYKKYGLTK